jgi:hypothetical protein
MTAFTFTVEQLRAAPPEVQRWVAGEIAHTLAAAGLVRPEVSRTQSQQAAAPALAACTLPEAERIFELIDDDPVTTRLFFELAHSAVLHTNQPGLQALRLTDLLRQSGPRAPEAVLAGLAAIDGAFREVHGDGGNSLFAFDEAGHVFIHDVTRTSIGRLWDALLQARMPAAAGPAVASAPHVEGFEAPYVGPSEPVAGHMPSRQPA